MNREIICLSVSLLPATHACLLIFVIPSSGLEHRINLCCQTLNNLVKFICIWLISVSSYWETHNKQRSNRNYKISHIKKFKITIRYRTSFIRTPHCGCAILIYDFTATMFHVRAEYFIKFASKLIR